ncbi:endonuclease/exonuclease/phosphatase family protein [Streptomyces ficellus]|uniref:Endonuclease/exonuclease/phosphatase family protein n=1 Tax=Streptomyces ficellus TaxID=1977088 RepID=A0A6I6F767_9ACTN|nr:endonuclease/exonuclease/phosphatase family protein [Streptomyces ficellus]QGV79520.1 endonuclease/exonuclease/phosphatase family protein [Streptomyces ficellus]
MAGTHTSQPLHRAAAWAARLLLVAPTAVAGCRLLDTDAVTPVPQLLALLPWLAVPAGLALLVLLPARRPLSAAWAGAVLAVTLWFVQPYGPAATPARGPVTGELRVLAANVRFGEATDALAALVRRERPDLLFVTECDPACARRLSARHPYGAHVAAAGPAGSVILGALPLTPEPALPGTSMGMPGATVRVGGTDVTLRLAHPQPPLPGRVGPWQRELGVLREFAARHAATRGAAGDRRPGRPLVLAGDFNATQDHAAFRSLLDSGDLHDAARLAGAARTGSWPRDAAVPPYAQIDHVLVSDAFTVRGARFLDLPGSDHRALLTDLVLHARP